MTEDKSNWIELMGLNHAVQRLWRGTTKFEFIALVDAEAPVDAVVQVLLRAHMNGVDLAHVWELRSNIEWSRPSMSTWKSFRKADWIAIRMQCKQLGVRI